ncbi:MAG: acyl-CoA thioesterase [Deltaproteobacteria bacterium]|nr:acyl-CoA thioesterase [Deltaproteobacteria bacterium]
MMKNIDCSIPPGSHKTTYRHRVAFYETDAMGVVHHSNYLRFFEDARVAWLEEHDRRYTEYMAIGRNFAVTRVDISYHRSSRFHDNLAVTTALKWVRGASACFVYEIRCERDLVVTGFTEHAFVDGQGRPRRIPKEWREHLLSISADDST